MSVVNCPPVQPCACSASQTCISILRSGNTCGSNICQDIKKSGGSSAGATAGQAIGGAAAGLLVAFLVYWFWWRKRQARRSSGPQLPASPTVGSKVRFGADTKPGSAPAPRRSRLLSRQIGAEEKAVLESEINSEKQRQESGTAESRKSHPLGARDPFSDRLSSQSLDESSWVAGHDSSLMQQNRPASAHSSDVSFRSSHSTTNIPIAYIPAHANSMSISDGNGISRNNSTRSQKTASQKRLTITKTDSDKSIPGQPSPTGSRSPKVTPQRPSRDPQLDLRLPKPPLNTASSTGSFGVSSNPASPNAESRFSSSTVGTDGHLSANNSSLSLAPPPLPNRTISTISSESTSHMSVMSHMSYILDPPQIVTQDSARVAVVGRSQARAVLMPNTPGSSNQVTETLRTGINDTARESMLSSSSSEDPFADEVSAVIGQFGTDGLGTPTFGGNQQSLFSVDGTRVPTPSASSRHHTSMASTAMTRNSAVSQPGDVSLDDTMDFGPVGPHTSMMYGHNGPTPGLSDLVKQEESRRGSDLSIFTSTTNNEASRRGTRAYSTAPSNHDSILDGVAFMAPPPSSSSITTEAMNKAFLPPTPTSPYFPLPPPRSPSNKATTLSPEKNPFADPGHQSISSNEATFGSDDLDDLPLPNRPFAPSNNARESTSSAISGRSGYASVLEGIPFQLGLGGPNSQRGSLAYSESGGPDNRSSFASSYFGAGGRPDSTQSMIPPVPSLPSQQSLATVARNSVAVPTHDEDEVEQDVQIGTSMEEEALKTARLAPVESQEKHGGDTRASVDSFMQSAMLASQFSELPDP